MCDVRNNCVEVATAFFDNNRRQTPFPVSMRGTINYVCIYTRLMQTHARTHVRTHVRVNRHGAVCQQWLISICIPEFRLDPETWLLPLIFGIQVAYVAPDQDSGPIRRPWSGITALISRSDTRGSQWNTQSLRNYQNCRKPRPDLLKIRNWLDM